MGCDVCPQADRTVFEDHGMTVYTIGDVQKKGLEAMSTGGGDSQLNMPGPHDVFILSYTSGTTGVPKGVKITHNQVLNVAYAVNARMASAGLAVGRNDTYVSYLPAAHSFE